MISIQIETIPHRDQRYDTCGDWWMSPAARWHVRVSRMDNWKFEMLVAVHELVEMTLCYVADVPQGVIDEFDINYNGNEIEPGDDPGAPYHKQHCIATGIERVLAACMGVKWAEYERAINSL